MTALTDNYDLIHRCQSRKVKIDLETANTLRLANKTLHRWGELECGDGNDFQSWAIERDETTNRPYMVYYPHGGKSRRHAIADKEAGALNRVAALCKANRLHYYHQTDPRGCALYIGKIKLTEQNYSSAGVACY